MVGLILWTSAERLICADLLALLRKSLLPVHPWIR